MSNQDSRVSNEDVCRKELMCVLKEDYLGSLGGGGDLVERRCSIIGRRCGMCKTFVNRVFRGMRARGGMVVGWSVI